MNAGSKPIAMVQMDCNSTVLQAISNLTSAGFQVLKSFDLRSTSSASSASNCNPAACQMVVLIIYPPEGLPTTLVFEGSASYPEEGSGPETSVSLVMDPQAAFHSPWMHQMLGLIPTSLLSVSSIE